MLLSSSTTSLSREDLARALSLPRPAVDALIAGGALSSAGGRVPLREVERVLQSALLRLYHAEVERGAAAEREDESVTIDASPIAAATAVTAEHDPNEPHPAPAGADAVITRTFAEFQEDADEGADARITPRYVPRRAIGGVFDKTKFTIMQISSTGLRIRHENTLLPGEEARLTFALLQPAQSIILRARVVWTRIANRGGGTTFCISGLRVTEYPERLRRAVEILREQRTIDPEPPASGRRASATEMPAALHGLSDEEVASILRAARRLADDPQEASRWYARARYATVDPLVRDALPPQTRDRDRILGIWESLERKIDLRKVAGVLQWTRNARASSV
jgi:hypothetical protein